MPILAEEEGREITCRDGPERLRAVPHAVVGSANISRVVLEGPNEQLALNGHFVEGLLTLHFSGGIIPDLQGLGLITPGKDRL